MKRNIKDLIGDVKFNQRSLIIGSAFSNMIVSMKSLPKVGDNIIGRLKDSTLLGSAYNVADALGRFGANFDLMIPVGTGINAKVVEDIFADRGFISLIKEDEIDNGLCISLLESNNDRAYITIPGVEQNFKREWFDYYNPMDYDYFYISGYDLYGNNGTTILEFFRRKTKDSKIIFDPGSNVDNIDKVVFDKILGMGTILTVNGEELFKITKVGSIRDALMNIHKISKEPVIVRLGDRGATVIENDEIYNVEGFRVDVVDKLSAGDAHTGTLIAGLSSSFTFEEAVYLANKVSSIVVSKVGNACSPTIDELLSSL